MIASREVAASSGELSQKRRASPSEWKLRALGVCVVVLAAVLRLVRLDLVELHTDQAGALRRAEDLVRLGRPPLEGAPSSIGLPLEPHFSYLLAPFVAISRDPAVASAAVSMADVGAVAGTLWLGWRAFGPLAGLVAAGLYAASPSAVFFARRIWEPDVHPALAVLLALALERGVVGRKAWSAAATFPIVMLGAGVHFLFLLLAPLSLAAAVTLVQRRRWLPLGVGLATALLISIPLFVHLRATDFQEYRDLRYRASLPARLDLEGFTFVLRAPTGWDAPVAEVLPLAEAVPPPLAQAVPAISMALVLGGGLAGLARLVVPGTPRELRVRLAGLLVWLLLPAALTLRHQLDLHPHYYLMTLPASFLLIGAAAQWLVVWPGRGALTLATMGVLALVAVESLAVGRLLELVGRTPQACYGAPLAVARQTAADVLAFGATSGRLVFENDEAGEASGLAYLVRPGYPMLQVPRPDLAGLTGPFPSAVDGSVAGTPGALTTAAERVERTYAAGVRLMTASVGVDAWPGWRPRLALTWLAEPAAAGPLVWQVDLLDEAGTPVASHSGQRYDPAGLGGERVVSVFTFDVPGSLPSGDYRARLRLVGAPGEWLSRPVHVMLPPPCQRSVMP